VTGARFVVGLISFGIGVVATGLIFWCRRSFWVRKAHRLAVDSDIALPSAIEVRIVRLLRREYLVALALMPPGWIIGTTVASMSPDTLFRWYPWIVTAPPVSVIVIGFVCTLWPRWTGSDERRVTHQRRLTPRGAFTDAEFAILLLGVVTGAGAGSWGLWRVHAGFGWWAVLLVTFMAAARIWWWTAQTALDRPSAAGDVLELGWDDVIRFRRVRTLGTGAAWGAPVLIVCLDSQVAFDLGHELSVSLLPLLGAAAALVVVIQIFKPGQRLWRRNWPAPEERAPVS
jgi:hypothetical protein